MSPRRGWCLDSWRRPGVGPRPGHGSLNGFFLVFLRGSGAPFEPPSCSMCHRTGARAEHTASTVTESICRRISSGLPAIGRPSYR